MFKRIVEEELIILATIVSYIIVLLLLILLGTALYKGVFQKNKINNPYTSELEDITTGTKPHMDGRNPIQQTKEKVQQEMKVENAATATTEVNPSLVETPELENPASVEDIIDDANERFENPNLNTLDYVEKQSGKSDITKKVYVEPTKRADFEEVETPTLDEPVIETPFETPVEQDKVTAKTGDVLESKNATEETIEIEVEEHPPLPKTTFDKELTKPPAEFNHDEEFEDFPEEKSMTIQEEGFVENREPNEEANKANAESKLHNRDIPKRHGHDIPKLHGEDLPKTDGHDIPRVHSSDIPKSHSEDIENLHDRDIPRKNQYNLHNTTLDELLEKEEDESNKDK